jgi:uncharacterized membrane protein YhdT
MSSDKRREPLTKDRINEAGRNALWQILLVLLVLVGIVVAGNYLTEQIRGY